MSTNSSLEKNAYSIIYTKEKKLSVKIAKITVSVLTIVFIILIIFTVLFTKSAITNAISNEFIATSKASGEQVQATINDVEMVANDIQNYLLKAYTYKSEGRRNMVGESMITGNRPYKSIIYHTTISELTSDVEKYIIETARNAAKSNPNITGIGVMFEPFQFDDAIQDYAFYISETNADKEVFPFGNHSSYSTEVYYKQAADSMLPIFTEPYEFEGIMMVSYAIPVIFNNQLMGVIMADINITNFSKIVDINPDYPTMYSIIYNQDNIVIFDSNEPNNVGKSPNQYYKNQADIDLINKNMRTGTAFSIKAKRTDGTNATRFFYPITAGNDHWYSLTVLNTSDMNKGATQTMMWLILLSIISLFIIVYTIFSVLKKMLKPIDSIVVAAESIAEGNLDISVDYKSNDEIGRLSNAFSDTIKGLKLIIEDENFLLGEIGNGNFTIQTKNEKSYIGAFHPILLGMRNIKTRLSNTLMQINQTSDQVAIGAEQMAQSASVLSEAATDQAGAVEELVATFDEISEQIKTTARNSITASNKTTESGKELSISLSKMEDMVHAMEDIREKSTQISDIIRAIEDIATQTNLLSLNASIEAARAGEAGRGFSIVANQIGKLAEQSSRAAKNIVSLINASTQSVANGSKIAQETSYSLVKVVESSKSISTVVEDITRAASAEAESIEQIKLGINQISTAIQTNSATAEETAASSEELTSQAQTLKEMVGQFELEHK